MANQDQRPRFYESQYLGADDMNAVVEYGRVQLGRHELGAHTAGIAIGLYLVESPTPGAPERRNVTLVPGMAIDGFARQVVALKRELLPESMFTGIAYDADVDDPAKNNGTPPGRFVRVWLEYDETNAKAPAPGFERCDAGGTYARVQESYRFVIGDKPALADRRSNLSIAGQAIAADRALKAFDMAAGLVFDESIPHQAFPSDNQRARWLIPIGFVRWVAYAQSGGYFVNRNINPNDSGDDRCRKFRQYIGVPAETILATDGALVLRNRSDRPDDPGRFQARLQSNNPLAETRRDLVWVEGNLRAVGDIRLARGALRFADINGSDRQTPLSLERLGDSAAAAGNRALQVLIGPATQANNRLAVSTVTKDDPDPAKRELSEKLTVMSGGNVGIGNDAPARKLHVKGDRVRLDSPDETKIIEMRADGAAVDLQSTTSDLFLRSGGGVPPRNIIMNPDDAEGNIGIGTAAPAHKLDVKAKSIKLGLEAAGGGQLIFKNNPGDNKIFIEAFNSAGTGSASEMLLTGQHGANAPLISIKANATFVSDNLGVSVSAPAAKLHVVGDNILLENAARNKNISLFTNGSMVDLYTSSNDLSIRSAGHNCVINWIAGDGNVGVGTAIPMDKLHVGGQFMQVSGLANEQAVVGGEGQSGVTFGTRRADVQLFDVRNLAVPFGQFNANAWLTVWCREVHEVSDERAKSNIRGISGALDKVTRLRGVAFEWKGGAVRGQTENRLGLIAQEVQQVVPEAVTVNERGAALSTSALVPLLIEAIKELKAENEQIRKDLAKLSGGHPASAEAKPSRARASRRKA